MVTRTATNASTFATAVAASSSGDIITLAGGNYGNFSTSRQFAGVLTVKSTNYLSPAVFGETTLSNAWGWTFEDIKFDLPYSAGVNSGSTVFGGTGSKRITATRCEMRHNNDPSGKQFGRIAAFFSSEDITIQHCKISTAANGIVISNCLRCTFLRNEIVDMRSDGIDLYASQDTLTESNFLHKWRASWADGDHCDAIQIASFAGEYPPLNNTIKNNIIDIEDGSWIQAIFTRSEVFDATGNAAFRLANTIIEGNWIKNAFQYGVALGASTTGTVRNNTIIWGLMNTAEPYNAASIIAPEPDNHDGPYSTQAVPVMYIGTTTGSGILTGNRWYAGSYYSGSRMFLDTAQATMIAQGWSISDNLVDNATSGPARPAFVTDFASGTGGGGGSPVIPTVTGAGAGGRIVTFAKV